MEKIQYKEFAKSNELVEFCHPENLCGRNNKGFGQNPQRKNLKNIFINYCQPYQKSEASFRPKTRQLFASRKKWPNSRLNVASQKDYFLISNSNGKW